MKICNNRLIKLLTLSTGSLLLSTQILAGQLNGPHKHGEIEVNIITTNEGQLIFDMVAPAQDIVGFEDAPTTDEKKKAVDAADKSLYQAKNLQTLFNFTPIGSCWPYETYINSDLMNFHTHPDKPSFVGKLAEKDKKPDSPKNDVHEVGIDGHSDFIMSYTFDCDGVEAVSLNFAKQFPSIKKINIREQNLKGKVIKSLDTSKDTSIKLSDLEL